MSLGWNRRLRPQRMARRRDLGLIALWAVALAVLLALSRAVEVPAWLLELGVLGLSLQTLNTLVGLLLRDPTPKDYEDHKFPH